MTDASRTTISRMLADFEERAWIVRENGQYQPTPEGEFVASEVARLLENMETAEKLDGALEWLTVIEKTADLARAAGGLQDELRQRGGPLAARDAYVAGTAKELDERLAVADSDFDVEGIADVLSVDFL